LDLVWDSLKEKIEEIITSSDALKNTKLSNFQLVVGGGDVNDGQVLRAAFTLLNNDEMNSISKLHDDEHLL
jgi:hypothetical protein